MGVTDQPNRFLSQIDEPNAPFMPRLWSMVVASIGAMLALYVVMTDAK
jgi:hypothetical protein